MVFWTLHRLFGTCTLLVYLIPLFILDLEAVRAYLVEPWVWVLILVQGNRHAILGMTLGLHRYFSHQAFQARRWFEFVLSYSCAAANQGGMSWWAANHRHHHVHCDTPEDPHSPVARSTLYAWLGWPYDLRNARRGIALRYPETRWLDRWCFLVPWLEWAALWGFTGSRALATLLVLVPAWLSPFGTLWFNVMSHGGAPDAEGCTSRRYRVPSAVLLGESEHRDHHEHPARARRPGPDLPYRLVLRPMARVGAVWGLRDMYPS
ncbi:MAG: fatty acid desaturase [Gammaproteobacteria bacterium]